jgi:hypothetical protein
MPLSNDTTPSKQTSIKKDICQAQGIVSDSWIRIALVTGFALCSLLLIYAIGSRKILILQDLPDHIGRAAILKDYCLSPFFQEYFRLTLFPPPYILPDLINIVFLFFFNPAMTTKMFSLFSVFFLIAGTLYCIHRNSPGRQEIALFAFPLALTNVFFKGNLNFLIGIGALLFLVGYWWPKRTQTSFKEDLLLALAGVVLYGVHLVCLAAWFLIFTVSFFWNYAHSSKTGLKAFWPLIPSLLLMIFFFLWDGSGATTNADELTLRGASAFTPANIITNIKELRLFFGAFGGPAWIAYIPVIALYIVLMVSSFRRAKFTEEWLILSLLLAGFLIMPPELPNLVRPGERILLISLFWGIFAMRDHLYFQRSLRLTLIITVCIAFAVLTFRLYSIEKSLEPRYYSYYEGLKTVPINSVICPVKFYTDKPFEHIDKFIMATRQSIVPGIFIPKHIIIRNRKTLPTPPIPPYITPEMLRTYRYFILFGKTKQIEELMSQGTFAMLWHNNEVAIVKNVGFDGLAGK